MKIYETLESGIKIVDYDPIHAPSLAEFWNICGQNDDDDWGGVSGIETASTIIAKHKVASHYNVYLALDGETVVGYCSFGRYYYDANTLYIPLLGVRPDYRSKKIGKALVLQCVKRTIELGYPRFDLYTWSGNTAAVPLYKKCGFLWEDRHDSVHFVNFIPTIITTPLFADFFKKADWYADSTRSLEIVPDGKKSNGFEFFGYTWEKDGETLAIGYERSGRQMRMIETPDYKIELMAKDHELAFGMDYECTFSIKNKTGKPLNVKINGREDANIKLTCSSDINVTKNEEVTAGFHVGAVEEPQDKWKVHPCVLADLEINGHAVTFGLGINPKFPLLINLKRECSIDQIGMSVKTHVDIASALTEDAIVTFMLPPCKLHTFDKVNLTTDIKAKGKASIPIIAKTTAIGYEKLEVDCTAAFASGKEVRFTAPVFIFTKDMTTAYYGEDLTHHRVFNGPWGLELDKHDNEGLLTNHVNKSITNHDFFQSPKLGKPYDDEFNLIKPNVKSYKQDSAMIMEVEYISEKFPGLVVTQVYSIYAAGLITRHSKVENRGDKPCQGWLQDGYGFEIAYNTVFCLDGQITKNNKRYNPGGLLEGLDNIESENLSENWIFEDAYGTPRGYCWPKDYKPVAKWGVSLDFEIDLGELTPGQVFTTKPVTYAIGLFPTFNDLRNYAQQAYEQTPAHAILPMEVVLNNYNPIATSTNIKLDVNNNRDEVQEGSIIVSADGVKPQTQTNPHEDIVECNSYELNLNPTNGIALVDIAMNMVSYERLVSKALFFPKGGISTTQEGSLHTVKNGAITFKADPKYGHGCFSLVDANSQEWLLSQYPEHKPYSWFNPFIGGMRIRVDYLDDRVFLKEKISADFVKLQDNFNNEWQGICMTANFEEDEKLKGATYRTYFLTQPGLPILCSFYKLENNTGEYKSDQTWLSTCLKPDDDAKDVLAEVTDKGGSKHHLRMGSLDTPELHYENEMVIKSSREEKLYAISRTDNTDDLNDLWGSNKIPVMATFANTKANVAHGETFTSNPVFLVITDKHLPEGSLGDLERVRF